MKLRSLFSLYEKYISGLTDAETLLEALSEVPQNLIVSSQLMPSGPGFPPIKSDTTVAGRIEELKQDKIILTARVKSIKRSLIKELIKDDPKE